MPFWNFKNTTDENEIELRIDGDIVDDAWAWIYEWYGEACSSPNAFRAALSEHKGKNITVWIDSYGGDVVAAAGIYNALKEHKGKKTVKIDGKAMSAASVIAMAGDEIVMSPTSIMMIHNPWTDARGESTDMRHMADVLDEIKETIVNAYQVKTKRSRNKISELMDAETWMSAKTAVAEGFADKIAYQETTTEQTANNFMYSRVAFQNSASESMKSMLDFLRSKNAEGLKAPKQPEDPRQAPIDLYKAKIKNLERKEKHYES
jgi:ATP-dependent Clp protease, protease subunit